MTRTPTPTSISPACTIAEKMASAMSASSTICALHYCSMEH
jgi:hypothetical protein